MMHSSFFYDGDDESPKKEPEPINLYRYEYIYEDDIKFEWIWLDEELNAETYFKEITTTDYQILSYRKATDGEIEVYEIAHRDGMDVGHFKAIQRMDNGISYRFVGFGNENSLDELVSQKSFVCGKCGETKDFDTQAMKASENYYIAIQKELSVLWFMCLDCFMEDSNA